MPSSSMCRRRGSITPGRLLVALLAASAGGARAARVRAAARLSAGAHRLLDGLLGAPSAAAPPGPAEAAAAVVDFLRAGGAGGGGNATAAARPACAGFLARSLGGLNESWSDVQLEAALNSTCSERALFTKVVTNGSAEHLDCLSFSSRLARARRAGAANGSSSAGYAAVCGELSGGPRRAGARARQADRGSLPQGCRPPLQSTSQTCRAQEQGVGQGSSPHPPASPADFRQGGRREAGHSEARAMRYVFLSRPHRSYA
ncbi:unnamed protein product [Prorocentrum cordatum]|uniref:Subtilisin n=1 Tax=Prorocentrum cordatum TaxID=2364126 RepID=A0ABN9VWZ0_9DINO|nr:unnamed protein product [Polarella glacialis]